MQKVLSILNSSILTSAAESWLSFGSVFVDIYPKCIFLCALGLLVLYLRYLMRKPFVSTQTSQGIKKQQGRAKKERRTSFNEFRSFHGESQERRKLQSVVQSPCGRLYDPSYFRQALCQDPSCDVCNGATVKVRRLLSWASLEDCSASASSMASTVSVTETSFTLSSSLSPSPSGYQISSFSLAPSPPPPSIISTNKLVSLEDIVLGTPQGDSLPPEPTLPSTSVPPDYPLPHPLPKSPSVAQPASQQTEGPLRLENVLSLAGSHGDQFLDAASSQDACGALSEYCQQQNGAQHSSPSQLKCLANQEIPNRHSSEDFDRGQASPQFTVPENLLRMLERQEESQADALTLKDGEGEAEPFPKELAVWEKKPEPAAELQNSGDSFPLGGSRALLSELSTQQGLAQMQMSRSQLEAMPTQHFWGLPYLHSESMSCITTLSHCSSMCIWFNRTTDSPALAPPSPPPLPERQPPQTLTQSQSQSIQLAMPQAQLQTIPVPSPSSQSQVRVCGVYFQRSQETKTLLQSEIHHLEYNMMTKEPEKAWDLPSVVQKSQEEICLLPSKTSLAIQSSKIQPPRPVPPRDFPLTDQFQRKFEQHLRKRLILQRWGLPQGIYKSQLWVSPDPPESSKSSYGLSGFKHEDNKGPPNTVPNQSRSPQEKHSGSVSIERKTVKAQEQTLEIIQKYICSNSKTGLDSDLPSDQEINIQGHSSDLSDKSSGTSQVSQYRKKFETAPQEHLKSHVDGTKEDQVPVTGSRSGNRPLHFSSYVGKEENEVERPFDNKDKCIRSIHRMTVSGVQQTSLVLDATLLEESKAKRPSPGVLKKTAEAGPVPLGKSLNSSKIVQRPQGTKMDDKHVFVSKKVSNIIKEQLGGLQPQPTKISNASPCKSAKVAAGNPPKAKSTVLAGRAPEGISGPQESQASDFSCQVFREERFESESSQPIQAPEPPKEVLLVSDKFTYKPLPIHDQSPSSAPMNATQAQPQEPWLLSQAQPQELWAPSLEQPQEPWAPSLEQPQELWVPSQEQPQEPWVPSLEQPQELWVPSQAQPQEPWAPSLEQPQEPWAPSLEQPQEPWMPSQAQPQEPWVPSLEQPQEPWVPSQEQPQELWVPSQALGKGLTKDSPLSVKRLWPARKTEELGSGVAGPETLQPSGKSYHAQDSPTPGNQGKKPIPSPPVKAPSPPEHQFRKHVKHFFQWLSPDRKCKGQEALLKKDASPLSPAQDPEPKGRATFPGNTVAQKAGRDFGKVHKEQAGHRHGAADTMRPRVPISPPTKPVKTKQKKEYWVPTDPVQGRQFHPQAPLSKAPSPRFHNQGAAFVGQKRCVAEKARQLQKCEALQPRLSASHRESELRQNLLLSRAGKVPRGTPPFAVGTMLADMSRLCEQKILSQNFSGKGFVLQK